MRKIVFILVAVLCLGVALPLLAVFVDEDNKYVIIETELYKVHWKKQAQMGYIQAFVEGSDESIIGESGRAFYHSSDYGGWKDWGVLLEWEILEEIPGKAVVQYTSIDGGNKLYTCVAYYYDSVPYIKHEVTVTADGGAVTSFQSGHEPQFEVNVIIEGMKASAQPFPHAVYWTESGFFGATYGTEAQSSSAGEWDGQNPGRMELNHDNHAKNLKDGDSATITYYVAFGKGNADDGDELANEVQEEPGTGQAVSPVGALTSTWGRIRAGR